MFINEFEEKVNNAKELDFGTIFGQSMALFKKVWLQGLIILLLTMLIIIPFYLIIYVPFLAFGIVPEMIRGNENVSFGFIFGVLLFFICFGIIASVVSLSFKSAFYRICKQKDYGETTKDDYFFYFKKQYLGKLIVLSVIVMGISIAASLLFLLPLFYVIIPLSFVNLVFAFNPERSVSEILKLSFKIGHKKWLLSFGLLIVSGFLAEMIGFLMCCVGLLATLSFTYIPLYIIYKEVIGFENSEDQTVSAQTLV
ncbi:hypothetical protein [Formosa sp. L2A11]|uniref:hypothetical protein n=1 Tax=Formosa sp. L2A11 TaxID=2686363 RepID=UPI00131E9764|nr:hypothetical protein [Formosa sp. L2A11]